MSGGLETHGCAIPCGNRTFDSERHSIHRMTIVNDSGLRSSSDFEEQIFAIPRTLTVTS